MLSLASLFWLMIIFFGVIGSLRGWTREVIATSGLILSLFAVNQFGAWLLGFVSGSQTIPAERQQFYILAGIHLLVTFFSYQGPTIAGSRLGDRLRVRDNFQDKLLGFIVGGSNGYLIVGTLWSLLEYRIVAAGQWLQLDPGVPYPFDPVTLMRPVGESVTTLMTRLPFPVLAPYLPILLVVVFLFVIIVMI